jgi:hypothetical protein
MGFGYGENYRQLMTQNWKPRTRAPKTVRV